MTEDLHANCWHTTRPEKTARERAEKCGCIHMIGFKVCCECREYQDSQNMVCAKVGRQMAKDMEDEDA